jgi:hypothetical protein
VSAKRWFIIDSEVKLEPIPINEESLENTVCQVTAFIRPFLRKEVEKTFNGVSLTMESIMVLGHFKPEKTRSVEDRIAEFIENESPKKKQKQQP